MEEIRNFRMRACVSDEPFTLTICTQEPDDWQKKDILKIRLYDADFYDMVRNTIVDKIVEKYCGYPIETEFLEHEIKPGEKIVVTILDHGYVQPRNPDYEVNISVSVSHEYNNGSEILANINIKSLFKCASDIVEIASKLRVSSRPNIWHNEENEEDKEDE